MANGKSCLNDMFFGFIPGSVGETSTLAILIGAVILIMTGIEVGESCYLFLPVDMQWD
ncbi:MAG: RnfABCDGE type electron transport complex subunit D [Bacteroidales bacterium]